MPPPRLYRLGDSGQRGQPLSDRASNGFITVAAAHGQPGREVPRHRHNVT